MARRLLIVGNSIKFFISHRLPVALAASEAGYEVHVAMPEGKPDFNIGTHDLIFHQLPLSRRGKNPLRELYSLWRLFRLLMSVRPSILHTVTIKPVLYGGLAARIAGVPSVVSAISGLGSVFISKGVGAWLVKILVRFGYRLALRHPNSVVIFQNPDDKSALIGIGAVNERQSRLLRGSGVNLKQYSFIPEPEGLPVVTMASRLLLDKGVGEFVEAARLLHRKGVRAEFRLIGDPDPGNPATVNESDVDRWKSERVVNVLGFRRDIDKQYALSNVVCLPSYREGMPKCLLEAAACGRAVVTTDVPGCRDAIDPDNTGLLVPVRSPGALAEAIAYLIEHPAERRSMGEAGRKLAEREFSIEKIVAQHLSIYRELEVDNV